MRTDHTTNDQVLLDRPATARRTAPLPPPGWYPDPSDTGKKRYWDGAFWHDFTTLVGGLPQLPFPPAGRPSPPATRLVFEIDPSRLRRPRWTAGRVVGFVAALVLGGVGWAAVVVGIAQLLTWGELNTLAVWYIGVAVVLAWTVVASMMFPMAPGRTWRLVRMAWLPVLAVLAVVAAVAIANMIVP